MGNGLPLWTDRHHRRHYLPATPLAVGKNGYINSSQVVKSSNSFEWHVYSAASYFSSFLSGILPFPAMFLFRWRSKQVQIYVHVCLLVIGRPCSHATFALTPNFSTVSMVTQMQWEDNGSRPILRVYICFTIYIMSQVSHVMKTDQYLDLFFGLHDNKWK